MRENAWARAQDSYSPKPRLNTPPPAEVAFLIVVAVPLTVAVGALIVTAADGPVPLGTSGRS